MKVCGQPGEKLSPSPTAIDAEMNRQHQVQAGGRNAAKRKRFHALHWSSNSPPAVERIFETAYLALQLLRRTVYDWQFEMKDL